MDTLFNGLLLLLATVAQLIVVTLGIAVIYGLMRVINFAHGEFITMGGYVILLLNQANLSFWVALLVAPFVVGAVGLLVERLLIRYFYGRLIDSLLATFGLSLVLSQLMVNIFGTAPAGVTNPLGGVAIGRYQIGIYQIVVIPLVALLVLLTWWIFTRTMYGMRARAALTAPNAAVTVGINRSRLNMITFAIGAGLAGAAGALLSPLTAIQPYMGQNYLSLSFLTLVAGGGAAISGTAAAGGLLGTSQYVSTVLTSPVVGQATVLLLAIVTLRFFPKGLSARWRSEL
jgi:branched-subunit amino acid ABC-type transport system permease component